MADTDCTRAFERLQIDPQDFHHLSHLRVAWGYLSESRSVEEAVSKMRSALQQFVNAIGQPDKYNETVTQFWIRCLDQVRVSHPGQSFESILKYEPRLLDKNYLSSYYSSQRSESDEARNSWLEPDLRPLP